MSQKLTLLPCFFSQARPLNRRRAKVCVGPMVGISQQCLNAEFDADGLQGSKKWSWQPSEARMQLKDVKGTTHRYKHIYIYTHNMYLYNYIHVYIYIYIHTFIYVLDVCYCSLLQFKWPTYVTHLATSCGTKMLSKVKSWTKVNTELSRPRKYSKASSDGLPWQP